MADSESSSLKGSGSRSRRAWTVSTESEAMDSSGRSNGRSSIDSNERPKTQGGEAPDSAKAGSSGFSKLISSRRRRKKKNNNGELSSDAPPVPEIVTEQDLQQSRSNESRNSNSVPSSNVSSVTPEGEAINLLTDDSEPERYANCVLIIFLHGSETNPFFSALELHRSPLTTPIRVSILPPRRSLKQPQSTLGIRKQIKQTPTPQPAARVRRSPSLLQASLLITFRGQKPGRV